MIKTFCGFFFGCGLVFYSQKSSVFDGCKRCTKSNVSLCSETVWKLFCNEMMLWTRHLSFDEVSSVPFVRLCCESPKCLKPDKGFVTACIWQFCLKNLHGWASTDFDSANWFLENHNASVHAVAIFFPEHLFHFWQKRENVSQWHLNKTHALQSFNQSNQMTHSMAFATHSVSVIITETHRNIHWSPHFVGQLINATHWIQDKMTWALKMRTCNNKFTPTTKCNETWSTKTQKNWCAIQISMRAHTTMRQAKTVTDKCLNQKTRWMEWTVPSEAGAIKIEALDAEGISCVLVFRLHQIEFACVNINTFTHNKNKFLLHWTWSLQCRILQKVKPCALN